jgi:hypothetical protein
MVMVMMMMCLTGNRPAAYVTNVLLEQQARWSLVM